MPTLPDTKTPLDAFAGLFRPQPLGLSAIAKTGRSGPLVSVVMPYYRERRFLRAAVDSVLAQDLPDFELIVVDDCSSDPAARLIGSDPRVTVFRLDQNSGEARAANRGFAIARGALLARLDADDVAESGWLSRTAAAFVADPELGLIGSSATLIDEFDDVLGTSPTPECDFAIRFTLLFHNPFHHSGAMFRPELFRAVNGYRTDQLSNDHHLWAAMLPRCRARNLAERLIRYRYNRRGITARLSPADLRHGTETVRLDAWRGIGIPYPLAPARLGLAASSLIRGLPVYDLDLRRRAVAAIEAALTRVEAMAEDFARDCERAEAAEFACALRARMATPDPPQSPFLVRAAARIRDRGVGDLFKVVRRRLFSKPG